MEVEVAEFLSTTARGGSSYLSVHEASACLQKWQFCESQIVGEGRIDDS